MSSSCCRSLNVSIDIQKPSYLVRGETPFGDQPLEGLYNEFLAFVKVVEDLAA